MDWFNVIIILIVLFAIFLICREIITWYWKINRIVEVLESLLKEAEKTNRTINHFELNGIPIRYPGQEEVQKTPELNLDMRNITT